MESAPNASDCEAGCIDRPDCRYFSHSHVSEDCRFCVDCARTIAGGANMYSSWWKVDAERTAKIQLQLASLSGAESKTENLASWLAETWQPIGDVGFGDAYNAINCGSTICNVA